MTATTVKFYQVGSRAVGNRLLDLQPAHRAGQRRTGATRSTPGTAPARAAARRWPRATSWTPRCAATAAGWSRSTRPAASRSSPRRTRRAPGRCRGCTRCSRTPRRSPAGVAAALRATGRDDIRVLAQGGDGGTVDIGLACLSGMFERNDDVLYVCYDNEAYMNTGVQRSGATPPAARTATTEAVGPAPGQPVRHRQGPAAHRHGPRHPLRRHRDRRRAARPRGQGRAGRCRCAARATCTSSCPCPLGWGSAPAGHGTAGPAGPAQRPVPGVRGRARRGDLGAADPRARCRSRSTCGRRSGTPTCSAATPSADDAAPAAGDR